MADPSAYSVPAVTSGVMSLIVRKRMFKSSVSIGIIAAVLIGSSTESWSNEQILQVVAQDASATIRLLTAPHTGKKICDLQSSTSIKFFSRANHGPHKFAKVEVLDGTCAGKQGYVPWGSLDPDPGTLSIYPSANNIW